MGLLSFLFGSKPATQTTGGGLLATGDMQKAYRDHVIDAQSNGQQPMSFQDFVKAQQAKAAQQQQPKQ